MAKYKVGEKVRVRSDLSTNKEYYMEESDSRDVAVSGMLDLKGKIVTIKRVYSKYNIEEMGYAWTDEMFEPVFKVGDKVKLRDDLVPKEKYGNLKFLYGMKGVQGKVLTIQGINSAGNIITKEFGYTYSPEMLELITETTETTTATTTERKETTMRIKNVKTIDNKVVIVEFDNGDVQKAVCMPGDTFDFEKGVEVCVMKHLLGKSTYYKALKDADKQIKTLEMAEEKAKADAELKARREVKEARRKAARAERKRAARVAEMKEAYLSALKEYNGDTEKAVEAVESSK